jgi:membrane-bound acyltransferase YfiQ involved in biofilm formation
MQIRCQLFDQSECMLYLRYFINDYNHHSVVLVSMSTDQNARLAQVKWRVSAAVCNTEHENEVKSLMNNSRVSKLTYLLSSYWTNYFLVKTYQRSYISNQWKFKHSVVSISLASCRNLKSKLSKQYGNAFIGELSFQIKLLFLLNIPL